MHVSSSVSIESYYITVAVSSLYVSKPVTIIAEPCSNPHHEVAKNRYSYLVLFMFSSKTPPPCYGGAWVCLSLVGHQREYI